MILGNFPRYLKMVLAGNQKMATQAPMPVAVLYDLSNITA